MLGVSGSSHHPEEERPEEDLHPHPMEIDSKDCCGLCNNHRPLWPLSLLRFLASPRGSALRPQMQAMGTGKPLSTSVLEVAKGPWGERPQPGSCPTPCFRWALGEKQPEVGWCSLTSEQTADKPGGWKHPSGVPSGAAFGMTHLGAVEGAVLGCWKGSLRLLGIQREGGRAVS